jgi:hypothetical protein
MAHVNSWTRREIDRRWMHIFPCLHLYGIRTILKVLAGKVDGMITTKHAVGSINVIFQLGVAILNGVLPRRTAIAANVIESQAFLNCFLF